MRVDILDNDLFSSLAPSEVERYLTAAQWREVHREEETVSIWEHSDVSNVSTVFGFPSTLNLQITGRRLAD